MADGPVAAGAMLRQAREAAGVHLASLAMSLKVPAGRLEALETGRIDLLPDPTFARALAASMCRSLRIDPEPVLQLLPRTATSASAAELAASKTAFRPASQAAARARSGGVSRWIGIAALVLLVATAALIFAPDFGLQLPGMPGRSGASTAVATRGSESQSMTSQPSVTGNALDRPTPEAVRPAVPAPATTAPAASAAPVAPAPAPVAKASAAPAQAPVPPTAPIVAVAPAPAAPKPAEDTMVFETQVPAWIQVFDSTGAALVKRTVAANETVRVTSDALPLKVTVGHSDKTKVKVRGESYDLEPVSKGGVARFTVK